MTEYDVSIGECLRDGVKRREKFGVAVKSFIH